MSIGRIKGFPLAEDYAATRIPNAVLGRVLASINDVDVIKVILRAVWHLERQRGFPRFIDSDVLYRDRVLIGSFGDRSAIDRGLRAALDCGVLVEVSIGHQVRLMLNTESAGRATSFATPLDLDDGADDAWDEPARSPGVADAFRAYEENIGVLSPMIRESILSSLEDFTDEEITLAIRIAVENESRSWSFVAGVLRRWSREGVPVERRDGKSGRADDRRISEDELRRYLDAQRRRDRAKSA